MTVESLSALAEKLSPVRANQPGGGGAVISCNAASSLLVEARKSSRVRMAFWLSVMVSGVLVFDIAV